MLTFVHRHRRILLAQLPLAVLSVALLLWRVDVVEALRRIPDLNIGWAAAGLLIFTASKAIHAYRWRVLLGHRNVPLRPLFGIFLFSNLANALVPLRAGDLVRVELPSRLLRLPRAELASNVFIVETMFDGLAFVLLVVLAAFLLGNTVLALRASRSSWCSSWSPSPAWPRSHGCRSPRTRSRQCSSAGCRAAGERRPEGSPASSSRA